MKQLFIFLFLFLASVSCEGASGISPDNGREMSFDVTINAPAKTGYGQIDGVLKCVWNSGDKLSVISLADGKIATVDQFTTNQNGTASAIFSGVYTGKPDDDVICIYPALEVAEGAFYYSTATAGNVHGYFRVQNGGTYLSFAPDKDMIFLQSANGETSHIPAYDLMSGKLKLSEGNVVLEKQTGLICCTLEIEGLSDGERFSSVTLSLDKGTPFTDYMATMGLAFSAPEWTVGSGKKEFTMSLDNISSSDGRMVVYLPVMPNSSDSSLGGEEERKLTVTAVSNVRTYVGHKIIPAGTADTYRIEKGKINSIGLAMGKCPESDIPAEVLGEEKQFSSASGNSLAIDGNHLFAGSLGKVYVYNVADAMSPSLVSTITFQGQARQMTVYENKLFVTARETGTWIFDISNIAAPSLIDRYDCVELATGLDVAGDCMFIGQRQNGVEFVDISNPSSAAHIRIIDTDESQSVFYADGYLYSGEWNTGFVTIFDAHDLSNLSVVGTIPLQGYGDGLWVSGNRLYASTGHNHKNSAPRTVYGDGHGVEIWDLSDPASPVFISRTEFDIFYKSGTDYWMPRPSADCTTLFCGDVFNGMYVVDITNEREPVVLQRYQSPTQQAIQSVVPGNGAVYVAAGSDGFYAIECRRASPSVRDRGTLPSNSSYRHTYQPSVSGHFNTWMPSSRGIVHAAAPYGEVLFAACGDGGLYTLKLDADGVPFTYSSMTDVFAGGVAVRGDRLYVAEGQKGFAVYRIGSDYRLTLIDRVVEALSSREDTRICMWIAAPNDKYVVAGSRFRGYQFMYNGGTDYNPSYSNKLQKSVNVNYNKYIAELCCAGDMLPYATRSGFVWIDLSGNKASASDTNTSIAVSASDGVTEFRDGAALYCQNGAFHIIEPGALAPKASSASNNKFKGIPRWDGGNRIQISNFMDNYISLVDISDFSSPVLLHSEMTSGKPEAGCFWNGKAVFPCGYQGLLIEK